MQPRRSLKASSTLMLAATALYIIVSYIFVPDMLRIATGGPQDSARPMMTVTPQGLPGDPINIGLVGTRDEILQAFHKAQWFPADPVTLRTSITIGASVLLDKPDPEAPVSSLFWDGRRQDFAFEKPAGESADRRHHLRLWQTPESGVGGDPLWLGAASFDRGVELSRTTGEITHAIAADIDAERERVVTDLTNAGVVRSVYDIAGIGPTRNGRNGGGDRYFTDGRALVAVIGN